MKTVGIFIPAIVIGADGKDLEVYLAVYDGVISDAESPLTITIGGFLATKAHVILREGVHSSGIVKVKDVGDAVEFVARAKARRGLHLSVVPPVEAP